MFNYFGSKRRFAHFYPVPRYPLIIEPFAGAAGYSCLHRTHQVLLNDIDPIVSGIWQWIINATEADIDALPDIQPGEHLDKYNLLPAQRNLMGFSVNRGKARRGNTYQGWAAKHDDTSRMKQRLYEMDFSHWKIMNVDYLAMPDVEGTWFIDPPYQKEGVHYKYHDIDYGTLAEWCQSRKGQVIVCGGEFDTYLPFRVFARQYGSTWKSESIWTKD